jgi:hypothetical protein
MALTKVFSFQRGLSSSRASTRRAVALALVVGGTAAVGLTLIEVSMAVDIVIPL